MKLRVPRRAVRPNALADLARAAGVSPRTLNALCHQYRGLAPMVLLRNMRLKSARPPWEFTGRHTEVAMEHGFGHLGRFSAYYRSDSATFRDIPPGCYLEARPFAEAAGRCGMPRSGSHT